MELHLDPQAIDKSDLLKGQDHWFTFWCSYLHFPRLRTGKAYPLSPLLRIALQTDLVCDPEFFG